MIDLAKAYQKMVEDEKNLSKEELVVHNVGKLNAKKHLESNVESLMSSNIEQALGAMLDTVVF